MGFTFGTPASTATPASTTSLFGTKTTTTPSLFGSATTSTPTAGTLFGVNPSATSAASSSSGGLFGTLSASKPATSITTTSATPSLFGNTSLSAAPSSTGGTLSIGTTSLFNTSSTTPATNLFNTPASTAPTSNAGATAKEETVTLGGIRSDTVKNTGPKAWRNETVPEPVCKLVDDMKKFLKEQKDLKDEISRFSPASLDKVKEEVEFLIKNVRYLSHSITTDSAAVTSLKNSVISELKNCEIAQRTRDSTNLPLEISLPMEYFYKLVSQFEESIQMYKVQIDEIESVMTCDNSAVTTANIGAMLNRMQQIFVTLASKLHTLHEDVKLQKDFYLNYRKVIYKDDSNIFEIRRKARLVSQVCPTPFSDTNNMLPSTLTNQVSSLGTTPSQTTSTLSSSTLFNKTTPSYNSCFNTSFSNPLNNTATTASPLKLGTKKKR